MFDKAKEKHSKCPKFAFIEFEQIWSVKSALEQNGLIKIGRSVLNIKERQPKKMNEEFPEEGSEVNFPGLLAKFDWHLPAAKYLFKEEKMEHFLSEFVHALGCSRGIKQESLDSMIKKLVQLSDSIPENKNEIMPPHLSGMVSNISRGGNWLDEGQLIDFLASSPHLIKIDIKARRVFYLGTPDKSEARDKLRRIVIEGLFIYFFAKFCHGPTFKIKPQYYMVKDN